VRKIVKTADKKTPLKSSEGGTSEKNCLNLDLYDLPESTGFFSCWTGLGGLIFIIMVNMVYGYLKKVNFQ
jgi:hypothetical protein